MKMVLLQKNSYRSLIKDSTRMILSFGVLFASIFVFAQGIGNNNTEESNDNLLKQYIKSKGKNIIEFDSSNIKQFWIERSVVSHNNSINILLNTISGAQKFECNPLAIQLANVNESQDCKIEIISETEDYGFSVLNIKSKILSSSKKEDSFVDYSVTSATFHLEDTPNFSFSLKFNSKTEDILSIKKIILSFYENKESSYLGSPGIINYTTNSITTSSTIADDNTNSFSITGKSTVINSSKKILVTDNPLSCSMTIKNTGNQAISYNVGYGAYTQNKEWLNGRNYPYKSTNKTLSIIESAEGSDKIIVDAYTDWAKGCNLALNAKDDLSDVPNLTIAGTIVEIKRLENGHAEITLNKPLAKQLEKGSKVRVHGIAGSYIYIGSGKLQPGEEKTLSATIKTDKSLMEYSSKAIPRGVYYVVPIILSYSLDTTQDNTISISDYMISY